MGVSPFPEAVWHSTESHHHLATHEMAHETRAKATTAVPVPVPVAVPVVLPVSTSPRTSGRHITFILPTSTYSWLESMAVIHNYGSVHKSIRDLLCWACTGQEEDYEWLFLTPHLITPPSAVNYLSSCSAEESNIVHKQGCIPMQGRRNIALDARVSDNIHDWISTVSQRYLSGVNSSVLDIVCRCAIELGAADDIFESNECGHDLARTTAELYHDLGLLRWHVETDYYHHTEELENLHQQQQEEKNLKDLGALNVKPDSNDNHSEK